MFLTKCTFLRSFEKINPIPSKTTMPNNERNRSREPIVSYAIKTPKIIKTTPITMSLINLQ